MGEVCRAAEATIRRAIGISTFLGGRFPKISPSPLSDRERQIPRLVANGHSDLNIADALQITEGTVGRHLHDIFRKLGVSSRMELTDLVREGLTGARVKAPARGARRGSARLDRSLARSVWR